MRIYENHKGDNRFMFRQSTDARVALFLANGCEEIEALTVADILYRAGIPCTKVSIHETREVTSSHELTMLADTTVGEINFEDYEMLVLPGGIPGTPNLAACEPLMEAVVSFAGRAAEGKTVAAICAAPSILGNLGLLRGKKATVNPGFISAVVESGADHTGEKVTVDGNIITSQAMGTAIPFALTIVEHFLGKETADHLSKNILYT